MKPEIWTVFVKIGKQPYEEAYWRFGFFYGERAEEQCKRAAAYFTRTARISGPGLPSGRKYKAVKFVPERTKRTK